jgi:beta-glucanase (GH16 family)
MKTLLLLLSISTLALCQKAGKPAGNWVLTFDDEFEGTELDLTRWTPHDPWQHSYERAPGAITVSGGQLHIAAQGTVSTFGIFSQTYGRFEIRCRVPANPSLRPRFVLFPVPLAPLPRIDVFQTPANTPSKISFANHWGTEQTERSFGDSFDGPDLSAVFHTIAIEWEHDRISWSIDGKEKFQSVDGVPHEPMYLLIDAPLDIDYIRVYQRP